MVNLLDSSIVETGLVTDFGYNLRFFSAPGPYISLHPNHNLYLPVPISLYVIVSLLLSDRMMLTCHLVTSGYSASQVSIRFFKLPGQGSVFLSCVTLSHFLIYILALAHLVRDFHSSEN